MSRSPELARVGWVDERVLAGADLRHEQVRLRRLRSRHVLEVHRTWGVVAGLRARLDRGDEAVRVSPGVAYDACGAELVLARSTVVRIPAAAGDGLVLAIRAGAGGCAELAWLAAAERSGVPLGRLAEAGEQRWLLTDARRLAASRRRPALLSGSKTAAWSDFAEAADGTTARSLRIAVQQPPGVASARYFASVSAGELTEPVWLLASVEQEEEGEKPGFSVRVRTLSPTGAGLSEETLLHVVWVSVEDQEVDR
jgi:hypothetical protein